MWIEHRSRDLYSYDLVFTCCSYFFKMCFTQGIRFGHNNGCFVVSISSKITQHREEHSEADQWGCNLRQDLRAFWATSSKNGWQYDQKFELDIVKKIEEFYWKVTSKIIPPNHEFHYSLQELWCAKWKPYNWTRQNLVPICISFDHKFKKWKDATIEKNKPSHQQVISLCLNQLFYLQNPLDLMC